MMDAERIIKRIKEASRDIFMGNNDASVIKKRYVEPHVFVKINGKEVKITDITVSECNIYLETENT